MNGHRLSADCQCHPTVEYVGPKVHIRSSKPLRAQRLSVSVRAEVAAWVKDYAKRRGMTVSQVISESVDTMRFAQASRELLAAVMEDAADRAR